ncbi:MAG: hypothetical protein Tsb002_01890 [Wenzhouxiangellaceae bacterium]
MKPAQRTAIRARLGLTDWRLRATGESATIADDGPLAASAAVHQQGRQLSIYTSESPGAIEQGICADVARLLEQRQWQCLMRGADDWAAAASAPAVCFSGLNDQVSVDAHQRLLLPAALSASQLALCKQRLWAYLQQYLQTE